MGQMAGIALAIAYWFMSISFRVGCLSIKMTPIADGIHFIFKNIGIIRSMRIVAGLAISISKGLVRLRLFSHGC